MLENCVPNNCEDCRTNKTTCQACNTGALNDRRYLHLGQCYAIAEAAIPDGYGPDISVTFAATTLTACSGVANCLRCVNDYLKCSECSGGFYLYSDSNCYAPNDANIPDTKGPFVGGPTPLAIVNCDLGTCLRCRADKATCTLVSCPAANEYVDTSTNTCYVQGASGIPNTLGPHIGSNPKILASCQTSCS